MSKAAAAPCSSCPSSKAQPSEKANPKYTPQIVCVLEDVLPVNTDSVVKVKKFKKFLNYDLKTLNITGKLETYNHKNGFTHTKMRVTYQDKKTKKVNHLEIDVIDNTIKKVENIIKKAENTNNKQGTPTCCGGSCPPCNCTTCVFLQCQGGVASCSCPGGCNPVTNAVVSTSTETGLLAKTSNLRLGTQLTVKSAGKNYVIW